MGTAKPFARTISGKVTNVARVGTSRNGNPTVRVTIATSVGEQDYLTTADSMLAYGIGNAEYRENAHIFGLTAANRLNGYTHLNPEGMR